MAARSMKPTGTRIDIVEGELNKDNIITTLKPGFLCRNGDGGKPTVLRKAEVKA